VAQSVEALRHKTEGGVKFSGDQFFLSAFSSPGIHSAPNKHEYKEISLGVKYSRYVQLTSLPS
jgi:hypothetical protein